MRTAGSLLVLIGLVAGLAVAAFLFQWDSREREAELARLPVSSQATNAPANGAVAQNSGAADGGAIQNGKDVYNKSCNGCHPNGKAGAGPALIGANEATVKNAVRQGKGSMPAFGDGQISEDQMAGLVAYVKSLK